MTPQNMIWFQTALAILLCALFIVSTIVLVKRDHLAGHKWRVVVGSAIEGVIVGLVAGFLLMPNMIGLDPLRMKGMDEVMNWRTQAILLPAGILLEITRQGGLSSVPGLSFFLRPRRRAELARRRNALDSQIAKIDAAALRGGREPLVPPHRIQA